MAKNNKEVGGPPPFPLFQFFYFAAFYFVNYEKFRVFFEKRVNHMPHIVRHDKDGFGFPVIFVQPPTIQVVVEDAFYTVIIP
jgi:hypothetical protein